MRQKRVAFIGRPGFIENSFTKPVESLFKEVGLNTGNLAFWYAMSQHIADPKDYFGWSFDPQKIKNDYDVLVFPAANQLNPDWDMGGLADLIDKADTPLLICGLGAQASDMSKKLSFNAGTKRFLKVISERAVKVGVRGNYTAQVLSENNVNNVEVLGCPSNFTNPSKKLGYEISQKFLAISDVEKLVLNIDITQKLAEKIRVMFNWTIGRNTEIVNQAPLDLLKLSHRETKHIDSQLTRRVHNLLAPSVSLSYFNKIVSNQFVSYFDVNEWMYQLHQFDLSVGTRLHGNMLALQAGTPSIFMPHDSRTQELADIMALPTYQLDKITRATTLETVIENVDFDGVKYDNSRQTLSRKYKKLINDTGLNASDGLNSLTKQKEKSWLG
ncbi:polysaccharide pyruvyl transferase family protein [Aliiglaciecola sp. 2_MG-2023]|uniref:polysaccharide pyruvyl transferase family protein n=1 Tax=unclassified Aliiglaciecola TaxID=2593648 RepID=UPI0026E38E8E|nr:MULTISPECIES: polysaccharide pyruvyl transferase family protein [unclassified Aliiglaciecola]MDO6709140.1 polysaccharide pyruvyl transferase family protein [Aliiglaciecola sp. 2_MG-2023]MDO6750288.1 polysaccharide pyruvyl transferase family protein [Aliiglaciecola sp. 1_MG-2023]